MARLDEAATHLEQALELAAAHDLPRVLARALNGKALVLAGRDRVVEALALWTGAAGMASEQSLTRDEATFRINQGDLQIGSDLPVAAEEFEATLTLTRRVGDADGEALCLHNLAVTHLFAGRWDDAERHAWQAVNAAPDGPQKAYLRSPLVALAALRGRQEEVRHQLDALEALADTDDMQALATLSNGRAAEALVLGSPERALEAAEQATRLSVGLRSEGFRSGWPLAMEAALAADRLDDAARLLALVGDAPVGHVPPYLRAQLARYTALLNAAQNQHDTVEAELRQAITVLTDLDYAYWLARARADLAAWLTAQHRPDEAQPLLAAATDTFTRLGAQADLDKTRATASARAEQ